MKGLRPVILIALMFALAMPVDAHRIIVRGGAINFNFTAAELLAGGDNEQAIDVGTREVIVSDSSPDLDLSNDDQPISDALTKASPNWVFRARFDNRETPCTSTPLVEVVVQDEFGRDNRISSPDDPSAFITATFDAVEVLRRCRNNGSLRRIDYEGDLQLSGVHTAGAAERYTGRLSITVTIP